MFNLATPSTPFDVWLSALPCKSSSWCSELGSPFRQIAYDFWRSLARCDTICHFCSNKDSDCLTYPIVFSPWDAELFAKYLNESSINCRFYLTHPKFKENKR